MSDSMNMASVDICGSILLLPWQQYSLWAIMELVLLWSSLLQYMRVVKDCVVCGWAKNDCFMTLLTGTKLLLFCFSSNVTTISTYSLVQDVSASLVLFCSAWDSAIDTVVLTSHVQKKTFKLRIILHCLFVVCGD